VLISYFGPSVCNHYVKLLTTYLKQRLLSKSFLQLKIDLINHNKNSNNGFKNIIYNGDYYVSKCKFQFILLLENTMNDIDILYDNLLLDLINLL
jgi:hypothetical protein